MKNPNHSHSFDSSLEMLLDAVGVMEMSNGYWVKIEAYRVSPTIHIPHGVKYSLTFHDRGNVRILGYDNAHGIKPGKKYGTKRDCWDHKHIRTKLLPYEFQTAEKLLEDFWNEVGKILSQSS
jgi:hypothetical protein